MTQNGETHLFTGFNTIDQRCFLVQNLFPYFMDEKVAREFVDVGKIVQFFNASERQISVSLQFSDSAEFLQSFSALKRKVDDFFFENVLKNGSLKRKPRTPQTPMEELRFALDLATMRHSAQLDQMVLEFFGQCVEFKETG